MGGTTPLPPPPPPPPAGGVAPAGGASKEQLLSALAAVGGQSALGKLVPPPPPPPSVPTNLASVASVASVLEALKKQGTEPAEIKDLPAYDVDIVEKVVLEGHRRGKTKEQLICEYREHKRPEENAVYVVLKAPSYDMVHLSVETGLWSVSTDVEETLSHAYNQHSCVVVIFSVRDSDHFLGYGFMSTQIKHRDEHPASMQQDLELLPSAWTKPFRVSWVRVGGLSFDSCTDISNTKDGGRSVTQAQDGQVLSAAAGSELCNYIDAASVPVALKVGVSRNSVANKPKTNRLKIDVTDMTFDQYMLAVLTKRKQRLTCATRMQKKMGIKKNPTAGLGALGTSLPVQVPAPSTSTLAALLSNPQLASLLGGLGR